MPEPASRAIAVLHALSAIAMSVFVLLFAVRNQPGLTNFATIGAIGCVYVLLYAAASPALAGALFGGRAGAALRLFYLATVAVLVAVFLNGAVLDYYQPLSLYDDVIAALVLAWLLLIAALFAACFVATARFAPAALVALAGPLFLLLVHQVSNPQPVDSGMTHQQLFVGGEGGYDIYRIPGLLVVPAGSTLASGARLQTDRTVVFAEARRNGALDTGVIDLVQRVSDDGGDTWSQAVVVCRHQTARGRGKCGNPTPVFDSDTGMLWLGFNLSGVATRESADLLDHAALVMPSSDGAASWGKAIPVAGDNLVFGPGHGIQKHIRPARGRLVLPAYRPRGALALISDDHGISWYESDSLGEGNETEIAELADGSLYLATRHAAPIGRAPAPNGRLYARSNDGGLSWSETRLTQQLPTPVCQASVLTQADGTLLFSNPAHEVSRVMMTLRASRDNGESWPENLLVYPGPSGYSQLAQLSNGDVMLVYESGRMSYSERISMARVPARLIAQPGVQ